MQPTMCSRCGQPHSTAAPAVGGVEDGQPDHQVQGMADKTPGDENREKCGNKNDDSGDLYRHKMGQCLGDIGSCLRDSLVHRPLEGLRVALEEPGLPQWLQKLLQRQLLQPAGLVLGCGIECGGPLVVAGNGIVNLIGNDGLHHLRRRLGQGVGEDGGPDQSHKDRQQVLDYSAAGSFSALLTGGQLSVYDGSLEYCAGVENSQGHREAAQRYLREGLLLIHPVEQQAAEEGAAGLADGNHRHRLSVFPHHRRSL